jgi:agmatinase
MPKLTPTLQPYLEKPTEPEEAQYILFGAPLDKTTSNRRGTRYAPNAIRYESSFMDTYSPRTGLDWGDISLSDIGDLECPNVLNALTTIEEQVGSLRKVTFMLGGEHTITLGAVRALKPELLVVFDAHLDLRDTLFEQKYCHATYLRRAFEEVSCQAIVIGARALSAEEVIFLDNSERLSMVTSHEMMREGVESCIQYINEMLEGVDSAYLSVDMDVLDPAYAPAVGNPHPEGLSTSQVMEIISGVMSPKFRGFDINEVYPHYDTGQTAVTAAYIVMETLYSHINASRLV